MSILWTAQMTNELQYVYSQLLAKVSKKGLSEAIGSVGSVGRKLAMLARHLSLDEQMEAGIFWLRCGKLYCFPYMFLISFFVSNFGWTLILHISFAHCTVCVKFNTFKGSRFTLRHLFIWHHNECCMLWWLVNDMEKLKFSQNFKKWESKFRYLYQKYIKQKSRQGFTYLRYRREHFI